jgi:hypothetical protein
LASRRPDTDHRSAASLLALEADMAETSNRHSDAVATEGIENRARGVAEAARVRELLGPKIAARL